MKSKTKLNIMWSLSFAVVFVLGVIVGGWGVNTGETEEPKVEQVQDAEYESLLGIIEDIPHIKKWTIERDKYIGEHYDEINWDLDIYYDDGTSVGFDKRESMFQLFEDLENLNEAELYTSPKVDEE
jgi:hypothetical protein